MPHQQFLAMVKLLEAEEMCSQLHKQLQRCQSRNTMMSSPILNANFNSLDDGVHSPYDILREAKQEVKMLTKHAKALEKEKSDENGSKEDLKNENDDEKEKDDTPKDKENEDLMNGEVDEDEGEDESSDESDSDEKTAADTCDLAQLTHDISIKQKLIEALEQSQQRLRLMRRHYEEKLLQLETKIKETEIERDRVLASLSGNKENKSEEKVKKVKEEFSKKLGALQSELKKMQVIKKEHVQAMRNQAQSERQIQQLKNDVAEMKKAKVRLINKMKEDSKHHLMTEQRRNREIAQLKKQSRMKENQIRTLEAEKRMKENVLKRKQEEIMALRKSAKPMSDRVAGRVSQSKDSTFIIRRRQLASPKAAKLRWQSLEKSINQLVINRQSVNNTERDMERYLKERERLNKKLEILKQKRETAVLDKKSQDIIQSYDDDIETLKATIDYCQENISECQSTIVQMEETKEDIDLQDVEKFVANLGTQEAKYFLAKSINMAINQTFQVVQRETEMKELEAKLRESNNNHNIYLQFLERLVEDGNTDVLNYITANDDQVSWSQCSSRSSSPVDSSVSEAFHPASDCSKSKKRRKKTGLPSEFQSIESQPATLAPADSCPSVAEPPEKPAISRLAWSFGPALKDELDLDKTLTGSPTQVEERGIVRVTSAPTSLQDMVYGRKAEKSPLLKRRSREKHVADFSPAFNRKFYSNASVIPLPSLSRQSSTETTVSDTTPPNSPSASRKAREDSNVFSRLTSGSFRLNKPGSGVILPFSSKMNLIKSSPLICTHTAEGHSRAILSLHATDDVLFSGSKDRTVKIWDLVTGKEIQSLGGHPNNVVSVRYSEYSRLAFSVSTAFVKVWDVRENPAKCVQTLSSSGASNSGTPALNTPSRTLLMPQGEHQINDIALNRYGTTLFSAASNVVRIWDLRMYKAVGKLSGSHQAAIMCLAVDNDGSDKNIVVTGSKDHYIKVFEVTEGTGGLHLAKTNLKPPHYDGIQSLAINGNFLFSGSRDMCIKKWSLKNGNLIQSLNQAHKDWICALNFLSNNSVLLSGCRGGYLKLWATETTQLLGEIKAHSAPINAISSNSSCTFTASSDCTIVTSICSPASIDLVEPKKIHQLVQCGSGHVMSNSKTTLEERSSHFNDNESSQKKKKKRNYLFMLRLLNFLSDGLSAAGVSHIARARSGWRRLFWTAVITTFAVLTLMTTIRVIKEYFKYPKAWQTKSTSAKELEFPAVTVCGRYLIPRMNAKEAKLEYMNDLYKFLHSIPSYNVSLSSKTRCEEDPLCSYNQLIERCRCYQNPCGTTLCHPFQNNVSCNCSKRLCDWKDTLSPEACQLKNGNPKICSCRQDFEYPLYNPNASRAPLDVSILGNVSKQVLDVIRQIRLSKSGDINTQDSIFLPGVRTLDDYGTSYDALVVSCNFQGLKCNVLEDFTTLYSATYGKCYTFNYVGVVEAKLSKTPRIVKSPGRNYGLHLYLQSERKNMLPLFARKLGARVVIHDPRSLPISREGGFDVRHGDTTSLSIRYSEINRLGPPWGLCAKDGDNTTSSYLQIPYNQIACERQCLNTAVFRRCECYHRRFMTGTPRPTGERLCTPEKDRCFETVLQDINEEKIECNCPVPCKEIKYKITISRSKLNKEFIRLVKKAKSMKVIQGVLSTVEPEFKLDLLGVSVFYQDLSVTNVSETSIYSFEFLIANIGGSLGLFLGASFITFVEIVEFLAEFVFVQFCWTRIKKFRR
ncbi:Kinesin-like protein KIF21A like protein [Argiope bruennichi]|uniref:Kinesin-like protein KIF21A like protein n=1 Tax=Argiope bruennichi TaxID=94029 RepID=A0A8T0EUU9_ARGBR|nr:Kinesin-like protein KIF21A like protein [Argiope bruennichi]